MFPFELNQLNEHQVDELGFFPQFSNNDPKCVTKKLLGSLPLHGKNEGKDLFVGTSGSGVEGGAMKLICVCLSFAILLTGCYSHATITKDDPLPPPNVEVTFRLNDGTYLLSHEYQRVENGYHIVGELHSDQSWNIKEFSGIIPDERISKVFIVEYDSGKTVVAVVLGVGIVVTIFALTSSLNFSLGRM